MGQMETDINSGACERLYAVPFVHLCDEQNAIKAPIFAWLFSCL